MTASKAVKTNMKTAIQKSRASKSDVKKATKKAMAQYGNALRNLANR
jgi:hypothetical protein